MKFPRIYLTVLSIVLICAFSCNRLTTKDEVAIGEVRQKAYAAQQIALEHLNGGKTDSAFRYFQIAKDLHIAAGDSISAVYNMLNIADIYKKFNDYTEVEAVSTDALRYLNNPADTVYNPFIYNNLGIGYRNLNDYVSALNSYTRCLTFTKDPFMRIIIRNNMANVLIDSLAFADAKTILQQQYISPVIHRDSLTYARIMDNLGFANHKLGEVEGLKQMKDAQRIRQRLNDTIGEITSMMHLANSYADTDRNVAISYAEKAATFAKKVKSVDDQLEALSFVVRYSNDPQQIIQYSRRHLSVIDSILEVRQKAKNGFAAIKYDSRSANEKVATLEADKSLRLLQQERQWLLLIVGLLILISSAIWLYMVLKIKHRKEKLREGYKVETRIAKRVHDELANDVYHAMTFAGAKDLSEESNKETLLDSLDAIYNRTRNISAENSLIDTGENFPMQLKEMMSQFMCNEVNVIANIPDTLDWSLLDDVRKIAIYRVVQELLVNMKKHSNATIVVVTFANVKHRIAIEYSDNGTTDGKILIMKNGLQNVENRIRGIGGTVTFDISTGKSFRGSISFPI